MPTNWYQPTTQDAQALMSSKVIAAVNEQASVNQGSTPPKRLDAILMMVINDVVAAVRTGGRTATSLTTFTYPGTTTVLPVVPPEAQSRIAALVLGKALGSTPQLAGYAENEYVSDEIKAARKWLDAVAAGDRPVTPPSDPDPAYTPVGPTWGDGDGVPTPNTAAVAGQAGVSVVVPGTTPGQLDVSLDNA